MYEQIDDKTTHSSSDDAGATIREPALVERAGPQVPAGDVEGLIRGARRSRPIGPIGTQQGSGEANRPRIRRSPMPTVGVPPSRSTPPRVQRTGAADVIRRNTTAVDGIRAEFEKNKAEYAELRREVGRLATRVGLVDDPNRIDEGQLDQLSGASRLALRAMLDAGQHEHDAVWASLPGGPGGIAAARDQMLSAISKMRKARTFIAMSRSTGREMVAAKAGTKKTAAQLSDLVDADVEFRAAEVFEVLRGRRGASGGDEKKFHRLAQWLSDGQGRKVAASYRDMYPTMCEAVAGSDSGSVPQSNDLITAIQDVFGADSPRTTYLRELVVAGRTGPEGRMIAALGLLGPQFSMTFGFGLGDEAAVLKAAKTVPPEQLRALLGKYGSSIRSTRLKALLHALADKQALDETVAAVEPLGLGIDDVAPAGSSGRASGKGKSKAATLNAAQVEVERTFVVALLRKYGRDRDKLLPELIQWSYSTEPAIIRKILRPELEKYYAADMKKSIDMQADTKIFIDALVGATGVVEKESDGSAPVDPADPRSPEALSGRRRIQIETLIDDHNERWKKSNELSKGGPVDMGFQLQTSPTFNGRNLVQMIDQVLEDGEAITSLVARYGSAARARAALAKKLGEARITEGERQGLLDRAFAGEFRAGQAYRQLMMLVFDEAPTKSSKRAKFTRKLVAHVASLEPGEIQLVQRNTKLLAAMQAGAGTPAADPNNWKIVVAALGLTQGRFDAAARTKNPAAVTDEVAADHTLPGADETARLLGHAASGESVPEGPEAQTTEYWSARIVPLLSKQFGGDKNVVSAIALLRDAQAHFLPADVVTRTKKVGSDLARVSKPWRQRIAGDHAAPADQPGEKAKARLARVLATGSTVTDADVLAVVEYERKKAKGKFNKLQTKSGKMETTVLSMPGPDLLREVSNIEEIRTKLVPGVFPRELLDISADWHDFLASSLPRVKRIELTRSLRDRLSEVAAEDGSPVEAMLTGNGLTAEQSKLFSVQTRVMGDLDKERLLLSGAEWTRFNSLAQMRRQARNEELAELRGGRADMKTVPAVAVDSTAKKRTEAIKDRSADTREAQDKFVAMRKKYRDRIVMAVNLLLSLAFTIASLGFGLPAAAAWVQILVTSLWIVASTAAVEFTKWALMGDSQSLTEALINLIFSIPTALVASFVTGPIGFSADVGLRMALDGLKEGAPFLEIALRSFLVGNINKVLNAPVSGLQSWLTSEQDPEGTLHRLKGDVLDELKAQLKGAGISVLKGLAKASIPEGVRESDITPANTEGTGTDERAPYLNVYGGSSDPGDWATFAYTPTSASGPDAVDPTLAQIGWNAAGRQVFADLRNFSIELATSSSYGLGSAAGPGDLDREGFVDRSTKLSADIDGYKVLTTAYAKAFFRAYPDDVDFDPAPLIDQHVATLKKADGTPLGKKAKASMRKDMRETWEAKEADLHERLAALPAVKMKVVGTGGAT